MDQSFSLDKSAVKDDAGMWAWGLLNVRDVAELERMPTDQDEVQRGQIENLNRLGGQASFSEE
jgi:hypothetical protein